MTTQTKPEVSASNTKDGAQLPMNSERANVQTQVFKDRNGHMFLLMRTGRKWADLLCFRRSRVDLMKAKLDFAASLTPCPEIDPEQALEHFRTSHLTRTVRAKTFFHKQEELKTMDVKTATTQELIAEYNRLTGKNIKKFSSRAAGEKQVAAAQAKSKEATFAKELKLPQPKDIKIATPKKQPKVAAKPVPGPLSLAGQANAAAKAPKAAPTVDRSTAIAQSWGNKEVAAARSLKQRVRVTGQGEFRSVKEAFEKLGLPLAKHIKFRGELKAAGKKTFETFQFAIVD